MTLFMEIHEYVGGSTSLSLWKDKRREEQEWVLWDCIGDRFLKILKADHRAMRMNREGLQLFTQCKGI